MTKQLPFVHDTAIIDHPFVIGKGTKIWHFAHICRKAVIGEDVMIGKGVYVGPGVKIGDRCRIQNGAQLFEGLELGELVFVGPNVIFTNAIFPRASRSQGEIPQTIVEDGATIGAGAIIRAGITIGKGAFVGMGAVATKSVAENTMVYGVPAKVQGTVRGK